jgi:hypothetical protein
MVLQPRIQQSSRNKSVFPLGEGEIKFINLAMWNVVAMIVTMFTYYLLITSAVVFYVF